MSHNKQKMLVNIRDARRTFNTFYAFLSASCRPKRRVGRFCPAGHWPVVRQTVLSSA